MNTHSPERAAFVSYPYCPVNTQLWQWPWSCPLDSSGELGPSCRRNEETENQEDGAPGRIWVFVSLHATKY